MVEEGLLNQVVLEAQGYQCDFYHTRGLTLDRTSLFVHQSTVTSAAPLMSMAMEGNNKRYNIPLTLVANIPEINYHYSIFMNP
jgi:hypothetical protein